MEIKDLSWNEQAAKRQNSPLLPKSIRGLLVGKSGCGKTTLLLNLLLQPGWLDYNRLYVFGKSLFQPEYTIIKKGFEEKIHQEIIMKLFDTKDEIIENELSPSVVLEEMAKSIQSGDGPECKFYESSEDVPNPRYLDRSQKNLFMFDDLHLEKQNVTFYPGSSCEFA